MKRHERFEPMEYRHEQLMGELNDFMITAKVWLFEEAAKLRPPRQKPTVQEMDSLMIRIMAVLKEDAKPMIRY